MHRRKGITAGIASSKKGFAILDPCYVLSDSVYYDFWEKKKNFAEGVFDYEGSSFAIARTAHGDGVYYDNHAHKYPVDTGVIALIPLELVSNKSSLKICEVFKIPGEAEFLCEDGVFDITFSNGYNVHINTKWDDSDCFDDEEEYSDDDDEYDEDFEDDDYEE